MKHFNPVTLFCLMAISTFPMVKPDCVSAFDVLQLQDMTSSFDSLWLEMSKQVGSVMELITNTHPNSYFGFATFGDKNLEGTGDNGKKVSLGFPTDYCFHVDASLDTPDSDAMVKLFTRYHNKAAGGGGDWSEGVFEGLYRALIAPKLGWRSSVYSVIGRVVVVITDALTHFEGDVGTLTSINVRPNDISAEGMIAHGNDENYDCDKTDYPSLDQVADLLKQLDVHLIILAAPGGTFSSEGKFSPAASLAKKGKQYRQPDGLAKYYYDAFSAKGVDIVTAQLDPDMTSYQSAFEDAFSRMREQMCPTTTTTSTTTTTTTTSTTYQGFTTTTTATTTTMTTTTFTTTTPHEIFGTALPGFESTTTAPTTTTPTTTSTTTTSRTTTTSTTTTSRTTSSATTTTTFILYSDPSPTTTTTPAISTPPATTTTTSSAATSSDKPTSEAECCVGCPCTEDIDVKINVNVSVDGADCDKAETIVSNIK